MKNKIEEIIESLKNDIQKSKDERKKILREIHKRKTVTAENIQAFNYVGGVINQSEAIIYQLKSII